MDPASLFLYVFFLMCSAYFACSETAYTAVSKVRLRTLADKGSKRAQKAMWICERFDKTLTTILVGNNVFHAACASLSALLVMRQFDEEYVFYGTLLTTQSFSYGLDKETVRPYVEIAGKRYYSTNVLYTSDNWATNCTGTHGDNWPTPHATLHVTFTYDGHRLTVYRGGLIDQVIEAPKLKATQVATGDIPTSGVQFNAYDRCLMQYEVKGL